MNSMYTLIGLLYYNVDNEEQLKIEIKKRSNFAISGMVISTIVAVLFCASYSNPNLIFLNWMTTTLLGIFPLGVFIYTSVAVVLYVFGVKKYWMPESTPEGRVLEAIETEKKFIIDTIEKESNKLKKIDSTRCNKCEKYGASRGMIECGLMKYNSHKDFIVDFINTKEVESSQIKRIKEDFSRARYAKLLCILSNPQYFDTTNIKQLESLTDYFISFYPVLKDKTSRIKRIFSISAVRVRGDEGELKKDKQKCIWLFQYLIINMITGVETYLLLNEKELICAHIDYVIGKFDGERLFERFLYFSYEPDGISKNSDNVVICSDQLLANIVEKDFYERLYGKTSNDEIRDNYPLRKNNKEDLKQIVNTLELSDSDVSSAIAILINNISNCQRVKKEIRTELVSKVESIEFKKN